MTLVEVFAKHSEVTAPEESERLVVTGAHSGTSKENHLPHIPRSQI